MRQVKGTSMEALDILEINDIMRSRRLETGWQILDQAHAKLIGEIFGEAFDNLDSDQRRHGQSMNDSAPAQACCPKMKPTEFAFFSNRIDCVEKGVLRE